MGLQDRDYYWKNRNKTTEQNNQDAWLNEDQIFTQKKPSSLLTKPLKYLSVSISLLALMTVAFNASEKVSATRFRTLLQTPLMEFINPSTELIPGGIMLRADWQGHFRGTVTINNVPMPFMIDTGATGTVVPAKLARVAGLPLGMPVQAHTAGGQVWDRMTHINTLEIGSATVNNLDAYINEHIDEVLIGMNT